MSSSGLAIGGVFLLTCVARLAFAAAPLEVYGRLPSLEAVALSPDGARIAYVRTSQDLRMIAVESLADQKVLGTIRVREQKLRGVQWADNDHLMIVTSATGVPTGLRGNAAEWSLLQVYDVATRMSIPVPGLRKSPSARVRLMNVIAGAVMVRHVNGHTVLFVPAVYVEKRTLPALISFDLQTQEEKLVSAGQAATRQWLVDAGGEVVAEQDYDEQSQKWLLKIRNEGRLRTAAWGRDPVGFPDILGFGPTAETLLLRTADKEDSVWRLMSLTDGKLSPPMLDGRVLSQPIEDPACHCIVGGVYFADDSRYVFFDAALQMRWDAVVRAFDGEHVRLVSVADGLRKLVVRVDGPKHGLLYELVDLNAHRADEIGAVYEGITLPLEVRRITYPAADGMQIPAYLTLPHARAADALPLIVLAHGGPAVRDTAEFDWWAQSLADQGYAVLQANYRGSSLGGPFLRAGFGEWGRKMQTDLSDGVRYLVKEGIVDANRVCIVGASYGGYAALAGVTLDPGIYRCAISVAGISDLKRWLAWVNGRNLSRENASQRFWDQFMGVSGPNDPVLDSISPIKHLAALTVPVLLIHGRDDTVVPFEQSSEMFDALRRAKKEVEFVTLQGEDHWLSRSETRLQMLQATVTFLRSHNPPN
jgi:dipeptidyl aminopeptidase/acylaminoacyl peptidase